MMNKTTTTTSKFDGFDRTDQVDTTTLWCPCKASFTWSGMDERLNGWVEEHYPHTYPEHKKLEKVKDLSQSCGEFLDWLLSSRGYTLGQYHIHGAECYEHDLKERNCLVCKTNTEFLFPAPHATRRLLAEFFEVDENKLEDEKRRMLDAMRKKS